MKYIIKLNLINIFTMKILIIKKRIQKEETYFILHMLMDIYINIMVN